MAYTYNGDIVTSVLECGQAMYDKFLDENGNFHSGDTTQDGEADTWSDNYIGIGKNDYYYYRYYGALRNVSGSVDDYSLLFSAFRTPFNINDDMIRPFFMRTKDNFPIYKLYVGVKKDKGNWNFTSNRYGNINNSINTSLLDGTADSSSLFTFSIISGNDSNNTVNCNGVGKSKTDDYGVYYYEFFQRCIMDITHTGYAPSVYSYGYGYHTDDDNFYGYTQDTNIPCFNEDDVQGIQNWIDNGDRSSEIIPPRPTKTDFKLWIKGLDSPTYKLNWHNEELEGQKFNFDKTVIKLSCGVHGSDGVFYHELENAEYNDGSVKFTWYDMDSLVNTNIIQNAINLDIIASYTDEKGKVHDSAPCRVDLYQKASNFIEMYGNIENGSDGSNLEVVNYEDDKDGFDSDDDDYHDPEDNTDDTQDDSTNISVSGEVCKTFQISDIELRKLSQFLWSSNFFDNVLLVNNRPIENIISLKAVIGNASTTGASQALTLGNVESTVNVIPCAETITINVGGITIPKKYNNFLDFEPYTKVQIYLPFYGTAMLNSSLVIGRRIDITYIIDVITGTAKISIKHKNKTLYEYKTTCACDLPLTSSNRASVEMGYISSGLGMGVSLASGNVIGAVASGLSMAQSQFSSNTNGNVSGVVDFHDSRMVTVMVDRPVYSDLKMFNKTHGRMCNLSKTLKNLKGYTKCADNVQLPFNCLDKEREMIIELLTSGVIL